MIDSVMQKVRLETSAGELVVEGHVPPFTTAPDVMIWGQRVFQIANEECEGAPVYRECFAVYLAITTPPPGVGDQSGVAPSTDSLPSDE